MKTIDNRTPLQRKLDEINGRRTTRLLTHTEIMREAEKLLAPNPPGHQFLHGGHVANAYGYSAYATGAAIWRTKRQRTVWCVVRKVSATSGATGFGRFDHFNPDRQVSTYDITRTTLNTTTLRESEGIKITRRDWAIYRSRAHLAEFAQSQGVEPEDSEEACVVAADWHEERGNTQAAEDLRMASC
jgi:hypothetical protein